MLFLWTTHFVDMPTQMKSAKRTMMGRHITVCASHIIQRRMYRRKSLQHRKQNRNIERQEMRSEEITRVLFAYFWRHWCAWRAECLVCEEKTTEIKLAGKYFAPTPNTIWLFCLCSDWIRTFFAFLFLSTITITNGFAHKKLIFFFFLKKKKQTYLLKVAW